MQPLGIGLAFRTRPVLVDGRIEECRAIGIVRVAEAFERPGQAKVIRRDAEDTFVEGHGHNTTVFNLFLALAASLDFGNAFKRCCNTAAPKAFSCWYCSAKWKPK